MVNQLIKLDKIDLLGEQPSLKLSILGHGIRLELYDRHLELADELEKKAKAIRSFVAGYELTH